MFKKRLTILVVTIALLAAAIGAAIGVTDWQAELIAGQAVACSAGGGSGGGC